MTMKGCVCHLQFTKAALNRRTISLKIPRVRVGMLAPNCPGKDSIFKISKLSGQYRVFRTDASRLFQSHISIHIYIHDIAPDITLLAI